VKIIEALKKIKQNKEKVEDLQEKIGSVCANLSFETPLYGSETGTKIKEWLQSCQDLSQENVRLLVAISRTNLVTPVTIELGGKRVTKTIAEWIWRRREYARLDLSTFAKLTDRGLKEGASNTSTGVPMEIKIVRHYDPQTRDAAMAIYQAEPHEIDSTLEVINATTDLIEG
jgi:hypothetical protein